MNLSNSFVNTLYRFTLRMSGSISEAKVVKISCYQVIFIISPCVDNIKPCFGILKLLEICLMGLLEMLFWYFLCQGSR